MVERAQIADAILDIMFETCVTGGEADALISANQTLLDESGQDRSEIDAAIKSMREQPEDEIPDFALPVSPGGRCSGSDICCGWG